MYIHYCISIMETYWIICFMSNITPMLNVQYILTHIRALYSVWIIIYGYSVGHWQCVCKCMRWLCPCVCALCVCLSGGFFFSLFVDELPLTLDFPKCCDTRQRSNAITNKLSFDIEELDFCNGAYWHLTIIIFDLLHQYN